MGKATRLRRERQNEKLRQLRRATQCVAVTNGYDAECIVAAALLVASAQLMGHQLEPRAVALSVLGKNQNAGLIVGAKAAARHGQEDTWKTHKTAKFWDGAAHLVVTLADPPYLFDPSFAQFVGYLGEDAGFFGGGIDHFTPPDEEIYFETGTLQVGYLLVPEDQSWQEPYEKLLSDARKSEMARYIAQLALSRHDLLDGYSVLTK